MYHKIDHFDEVCALGTRHDVPKNVRVQDLDRGDSIKYVYALKNGICSLSRITAAGEEKTFQYFTSEWLLRVVPVTMDDYWTENRAFSIYTKTPCELYQIHPQQFMDLCEKCPPLMRFLAKVLAHNLGLVLANAYDTHNLPVSSRLCKVLLDLDSGNGLDAFFTYAELASFLGVHKITVARIITRLKKLGNLKHEGGRLRIVDRDTILEIANGKILVRY